MHNVVRRSIAVFSVSLLAFNASAAGLQALGTSVAMMLSQWRRGYPGQFTDRPGPINYGPHPGRAPATRGGVWSAEALEDARHGGSPLWACVSPDGGNPPPGHTLAVAAAPGTAYPWEGGGGSVNPANGDKLTPLHLLGWKCRGGMAVDFTLYHNSQTNYSDELGYGWTWTYDIYINTGTNTATVHWGDGLCVPYTTTGGGGGGGSGEIGDDAICAVQPECLFTDTTYTPPAGIHDSLVHHTDGTWTLTKKNQTKYTFNSAGFCNQIQDRHGNTITLTLDSSNYVTQITDPTGRSISVNVNSSHKFTSITDPLNRTWSFTINGSGDLTTVTWPALNGNTYTDGFSYSSHRITTYTDRAGANWTYSYNTDGSLASETTPLNKTTSYGYTSTATTVTDPLSHVTTYNYSGGKIASIVDPCSYSVGYTWSSGNDVTQITDQRGKHWNYTYDSMGNVLTTTDPLSHTTTYTYNSLNDVLTVQDPLSHTWTATRDTVGKITAITDPLNHATSISWGYNGLPVSVTDPLNHSVTVGFDAYGALDTITDALGHTSGISSDDLSRPTTVSDALGHDTSISYDAWGRPTTLTLADDSTVTVAYNAVGQVTSVTDENGHTKSFTYNNGRRLTTSTNAKGDQESYGYDYAGRLTTVMNGRGKTRTYEYNDRGDVTCLTLPDYSAEHWSYDGTGNCTAYTNPLSQVIYSTYDDAGRQTGIDYPTGTDPTFSYDAANRRTQMTDSTGTTSWTYDNANRLTGLNTPQGNITYTYDAADRQVTMTDSSGTTTYAYDDADRPTSLQNPFSETTSWAYDNADRITRRTFANGTYTAYGYDIRDRATSIDHKRSDDSVISSESYVYDSAGNLSSKTVDSVTTSYSYDEIDQLTQESRTGYNSTYGYDGNGNRSWRALNGVMESYTYDDGDKLTSTTGDNGSKSYTYDGAGRTTSITTSAGTTSFAYDYEDRITQITYPNNSTNTFTYNAADTRVGKVDSGGTKTYRRDGVGVTAPVLSDGISAFTPGISLRNGGASKFLHGDRLGTLGRETDSSQATTATKQYDAFGNLTSSSGSSVSPFGFAGGWGYQENQDSGLKLLGHRYYDSTTGRFLTRDPAKDGRNWFTYCQNNPLRCVDPNGTKLIVVFGDSSGMAGPLIGLGGLLMAPDTHDWDVVFRNIDSEEQKMALIWALIDADEGDSFWYWGHGSNGSLLLGRDKRDGHKIWLTRADLQFIFCMRMLRGKGKMDTATVLACEAGEQAAIWQMLFNHGSMYTSTTGGLFGPAPFWDGGVPLLQPGPILGPWIRPIPNVRW